MASNGANHPTPMQAEAGPSIASTSSATTTPWWSNVSQQFHQGIQQFGAQIRASSRNWKGPDFTKGLGMRVDVDFLNPAITGLKQQWQQLPEPVREVMPYAGVALIASAGVRHLYQEQLNVSHQRYGQLKDDHAALQQQFKQLQGELDEINAKRTGAHLEIQMAEAVAKAASAAANAATAAAAAAAACSTAETSKRR